MTEKPAEFRGRAKVGTKPNQYVAPNLSVTVEIRVTRNDPSSTDRALLVDESESFLVSDRSGAAEGIRQRGGAITERAVEALNDFVERVPFDA